MKELDEAIREAGPHGVLPCAGAFSIAGATGQTPRAVGDAADPLGVRISLCQLGLFGYEAYGEKRWVRRPPAVPDDLEAEIRAACAGDRLPCAGAWRLADERGLPRALLGSVAETLGVRISKCQLGCFE